MCDYSLHHVASRPAKVRDKLVTTELARSSARGFAAIGELGAKLVIHDTPPQVAVCLLPGTELAFDDDVRYDRAFSLFGKARVNHKVARFRQIDMDDPHVQHDALEFPNGQVLKVAQLVGQIGVVISSKVDREFGRHVAAALGATYRFRDEATPTRVALFVSRTTICAECMKPCASRRRCSLASRITCGRSASLWKRP